MPIAQEAVDRVLSFGVMFPRMETARSILFLSALLLGVPLLGCGGGGSSDGDGSPPPPPLIITGTLDPSFSGDGIATVPVGSAEDQGFSVAFQPDGRIVVAGWTHNGADFDFLVMRLNSDGTLDSSFSGDGVAVTSVGSADEQAYALMIQDDGRILIGGYVEVGADMQCLLVRYTSDGSLDLSFDSDGMVTNSAGSAFSGISDIALQADGRIVAGGYVHNGANYDVLVLRYNSDGSPDTTFDGDGMASTPVGSGADIVSSVAIQANGRIVVGGSSMIGGDWQFLTARFLTTGALDSSFDTDGLVTTDVGSGADLGFFVTVQPNGRILLCGSAAVGANTAMAVVRFDGSGALDSTFGVGGIVTTSPTAGSSQAWSIALQPDGGLVVAGYASTSGNDDVAVVRYSSGGVLDATFDGDGILLLPVGAGFDRSYRARFQSDGKLVLVGGSSNGVDLDAFVMRLI